MKGKVVLGLLATGSDAESAVNNLTEEGVSERSISVVMANEADARAIADDAGPLKGATAGDLEERLTGLGLSAGDAGQLSQGVQGGEALLAITASDALQSAITETLTSYNAQHVQTV